MKDGYQQFFKLISQDDFFQFGLDNIISIEESLVKSEWSHLLSRINNKSNELYVRNSGRNGRGNDSLTKLYKDVFGIKINFDATNNNKPSQMIQKLTGERKNKTIFNYQISHVFGNTKNVYCFCAPWNVVFIPKIIDPFTGHESKGEYVDTFQKRFKKIIYLKYRSYIEEYNAEMKRIYPMVESWVKTNISSNEKESFLKEFGIIRPET
ncbi:MAG: hypothetical protein JW866_01775 [Ignavibacteriales bacterium]|nr:hypothetical protein [Ignavibacteriales bacterium]